LNQAKLSKTQLSKAKLNELMKVDVAIIGGGIAGLWTLAKLRAEGYAVILIESKAIGGIQSIGSQGIIHGGTKYALGGKLGDSAKAIGDMPAIWKSCLAGQGEIDLSAAKVQTQSQLMWSTKGVVSKMAGFFAGKMMQDRMQKIDQSDYPPPFDQDAFKGDIYQLNEPVLDTASLMSTLFNQLESCCLKADVQLDPRNPSLISCKQDSFTLEILATNLVLTAGAGNADLLKQLHRETPKMQKRPVHMTMLKGELPDLFAHCLGASASPRVTITSSKVGAETVWYVGGGISETGVTRSSAEQITACKKELASVMPWVNFNKVQWATVMFDRAEVKTASGQRPESSFVEKNDNVITVWPTKLAFAPKVAS